MPLSEMRLTFEAIRAPLPIRRASVGTAGWIEVARTVREKGGRLVTLWGTDRGRDGRAAFTLSAVYALPSGAVWVDLPLQEGERHYPDISGLFPSAARMERAVADLLGLVASNAADSRPWLNHGAWPEEYRPLRGDTSGREEFPECALTPYPFVRVEGDGVHEIPVGPVHAGIIEPGHFRFSVVGEKVLRLEERLGYKHKGIDKLFTRTAPLEGHRLAGRISGDSTVAFSWAYCMALESLWELEIPPRARWMRALMLERERVANHLGDLGALGNDAAFAFGLAHFSRLKEEWLRLNKELFGHRYLMDRIIPGGVAEDLDTKGGDLIRAQCDAVAEEVVNLRTIYDEHAGLQDRFQNCGRVTTDLAARLGLIGLAGRASGRAFDLRGDYPMTPYKELHATKAIHSGGDVAARVAVRFDEIVESLRLIDGVIRALPKGEHRRDPLPASTEGFGAGWIEGWRGEIFVALELDGRGGIRRCHCHDPSWHNWPVLEHAVIGNIVPDFPLINKSFNLSYAGHDR